jgi:hypothetical protein
MQRGTWIILDAGHGELDRRFVPEGEFINDALIDFIINSNVKAGDTIRLVEGESESA